MICVGHLKIKKFLSPTLVQDWHRNYKNIAQMWKCLKQQNEINSYDPVIVISVGHHRNLKSSAYALLFKIGVEVTNTLHKCGYV